MKLRIHFLNVGHGDCTVIEFPSGRLAVIDINDSEHVDEETQKELSAEFRKPYEEAVVLREYTIALTRPQDYISTKLQRNSIFRFICTHPDMDHISGIKELDERFSIENFWDTPHSFPKPDFSEQTKFDEADYTAYERMRKNAKNYLVGDSFQYFGEADDNIQILSPSKGLLELAEKQGDKNLASYVLLVRYGKTVIFLGGDTTTDVQKGLHDAFGEEYWKDDTVIFKAPHHGRDSGYCQPLVKAMAPDYTIVSVGKKPKQDASNKYRQYSKNVWSTRWKGNIVLDCYPDGTVIPQTEYNRSVDFSFSEDYEPLLALRAAAIRQGKQERDDVARIRSSYLQ